MKQKLQGVRGMNDLLPEQIGIWQRVESVLKEVGRVYGYQEIRTPMVEKTELFTQSIGGVTDIVEKEMYTFVDSGDEHLALRPEATASTVRACIQHSLLYNRQQRLWYLGPMFRRERPQKGRYRQFHQFGIEAFGWHGADIDAEVIRASASIWQRLGIQGVKLQINTLGSPQIGVKYRKALETYFRRHQAQLDPDSLRRLDKNPLRILDSKAPATQDLLADAPDIHAFLDEHAAKHFDELCQSLTHSGIKFEVNPRLVRGLDYYTSTVFEWVSDGIGAQNTVCAGGRYDQLVEMRGGQPTPAVGFALGLERLVDLVGADAQALQAPDVYVVSASDESQQLSVVISEKLRHADFSVITHCGGGKLKKQMKHADVSGARVAMIVGFDESDESAESDSVVQVKWLREQNAHDDSQNYDQQAVKIGTLVEWCQNNLTGEHDGR